MTISELQKVFSSELQPVYDSGESNAIIQLVFTHFFNCSRTEFLTKKTEPVSQDDEKKLFGVLARLKGKEPVQYVLGETFFCDLKFKVNSSVLIPRPETEELVYWILEEVGSSQSAVGSLKKTHGSGKENKREDDLHILDIGTGSGCIAISLKKNLSGSQVYAMDVSQSALVVAEENAKINNTEVLFILKDILNISEESDFPLFDIIVSNPPYICDEEKSSMDMNVLDYEPHLALFAGKDPLLFYKAISRFAKTNLKAGGSLFFEINEGKSEEVKTLLEQRGFGSIQLKKDINSKYRMISCKWNS